MLVQLSNFITTFDGRTYLSPPPFCCEGVGTVDTAEAVIRFAMLWKCRKVYLRHSRNNWKGANLIHRILRGEGFETAGVGAYQLVSGIVVLRFYVNTRSEYWVEKKVT
jgi:hypothetical protein